MKIRQAKPTDKERVMHLLGQLNHPLGIDDNLFTEAFEQALNEENHIILVAEEADYLVGYVSGYIHTALYAQRSVAHIDEIIIEEKNRRKGLGKELMKAIEENLMQKGCILASLATVGAKDFYERLGYSGKATYLKKPLPEKNEA